MALLPAARFRPALTSFHLGRERLTYAGRTRERTIGASDGRGVGMPAGRRTAWAAMGTLVLAGLAAPALAADDDLQHRVEARLAAAGLEGQADIHVAVDGGVVKLTGLAVSYLDYRKAERAARRESHSVENLVRVVPEVRRTDGMIRDDAEAEVLGWERYGAYDAVGVEVKDGVVLLRGWVDNPSKKDEIEERVSHLEGIRDVHNDLRVQGFSSLDRRLLREIHSRIYADPLFERWAGDNDPPVRVYVSRGRVTLAGTVPTTVEKVAAFAIARGTMAFSVSNQLQIEGEARREEDSKKKKEDES